MNRTAQQEATEITTRSKLDGVLRRFAGVYVLNLDRRPDKLEALADHLRDRGVELGWLMRVPGVDKPEPKYPRWLGSFEGHLRALTQFVTDSAKSEEWGLILEDDVGFAEDAGTLLDYALNELPNSASVLWLGYNPDPAWTRVEPFSPHLVRLHFCSACHAYALRRAAAQIALRDGWELLRGQIQSEKCPSYDKWLAGHFDGSPELGAAYGCRPMAAYQRDGGMSDNTGSRLGERRWR